VPELGETLSRALLRPTRIYVKAALAALGAGEVHALCHVTGGGLPENLPRVLPKNVGLVLDRASWARPPIFELIQRHAGCDDAEMYRTFNMGLGLVIVVSPDDADAVMGAVEACGETVQRVGHAVEHAGGPRIQLA
jgi:phosphoribosylformylglycinamidine cyclo-ligase